MLTVLVVFKNVLVVLKTCYLLMEKTNGLLFFLFFWSRKYYFDKIDLKNTVILAAQPMNQPIVKILDVNKMKQEVKKHKFFSLPRCKL